MNCTYEGMRESWKELSTSTAKALSAVLEKGPNGPEISRMYDCVGVVEQMRRLIVTGLIHAWVERRVVADEVKRLCFKYAFFLDGIGSGKFDEVDECYRIIERFYWSLCDFD